MPKGEKSPTEMPLQYGNVGKCYSGIIANVGNSEQSIDGWSNLDGGKNIGNVSVQEFGRLPVETKENKNT